MVIDAGSIFEASIRGHASPFKGVGVAVVVIVVVIIAVVVLARRRNS